jgi:transcriptional regulator with XRE-family HTH domain
MSSIAENLKRLRSAAKFSQLALAEKAGVSQQLISQLEGSKNNSTKELPAIAQALGVPVHEIDEAYVTDAGGIPTTIVPLIAWVSAGAMAQDHFGDEALGQLRIGDLPAGDWIALRVTGDSMDRISPPDSVIVVNRRDKRLVSNACYVIADLNGDATYKRYRSDPMRFEPVSTNPSHEPIFPDHEPTIVGRVKRSMIEM